LATRQRFEILSISGFVLFFLALLLIPEAGYPARVKDIAKVEGVRENPLVGYGLVVGLNGTGDKKGTEFTIRSMISMLGRLGIIVDPQLVSVKNVAAVVVTANLPPFAKQGSTLDVVISSIGDATSLYGGTLLLTPLRAANGEIYAAAQGPLATGGFVGGGGGDKVQKNHPTVGRIPGGARVEKEVDFDLNLKREILVYLSKQDFSTSVRLSEKINESIQKSAASPMDSGTVKVQVPDEYRNRVVELVAAIENLDVPVDVVAKVILNERTGTIVMGENVRISPVAISHGNLTVQVKTRAEVSQPEAFSRGETVVVPQREVDVNEEEGHLIFLNTGVSVEEMVRGLNSVGITPRDLIAILQAIKEAGALQSELEIM
jgi:flagellar P-ring protein precursor FlgI